MSGGGDKPLRCDMVTDCTEDITHLDAKGYIYCEDHGKQRQEYQRCRRLRPHELNRLRRGLPVKRY